MAQANIADDGRTDTPTTGDKQQREIVEKIEGLVHYGAPTCDVCYGLSPGERPEEGEFWPDRPVRYVNADARALVDWCAATLCPHHDTPANRPAEATHRAETDVEFIGRDHRMNSAHRSDVEGIAEVSD